MFKLVNFFFGKNLYLFYNQVLPPLTNLFLAFWISNSFFTDEKDDYAILITIISISLVLFGFNSKSIVQYKANNNYLTNLENAKFINLIFSISITLLSFFFLRNYTILVVVICLHCISELTIEYFKYNLNKKKLVITRSVKSLLDLLIFFIVINLYSSVDSRLLALCISSFIVIICFYKQSIPSPTSISMTGIKSVLSYTFPLLIYSGSIILFTMGDRFILNYFSIEELYTYFLMSTLANGNILLTSALMPVILNKNITEENYSYKKDLISWTQKIVVLIILISFFVFILTHFELIDLDANWIYFYLFLSLSSIFQLPYFFSIQKLLAIGNTYPLIPIGLSALFLSLILNLILINFIGVFGSCLSSILTSLWISYRSLRL